MSDDMFPMDEDLGGPAQKYTDSGDSSGTESQEDPGTHDHHAGPRVPVSAAMDVGARATPEAKGTGSFRAALDNTPDDADIGLANAVPQTRGERTDQDRLKAVIGDDGTVRTHDGVYAIDSDGHPLRYVLVAGDDSDPVLYIDQSLSAADTTLAGVDNLSKYPTLDSHGEITVGRVIGAGDIRVAAGKITFISNKSGSWHPNGDNLARTLKFLVRAGLVDERDIVQGNVTVAQVINKTEGMDVDAGVDAVPLLGRIMEGKLIRR